MYENECFKVDEKRSEFSNENGSIDKNVARMREKRKEWRFFRMGNQRPPPLHPPLRARAFTPLKCGHGWGGELVQSQRGPNTGQIIPYFSQTRPHFDT